MSDPFIAQITMFGGNFAPRGWTFCAGQVISISQNTAVFLLLGTSYSYDPKADGRTAFQLPDLRGRSPLHPGTAVGVGTNKRLGQRGGQQGNWLTLSQLPTHNHIASFNGPDMEADAKIENLRVHGARKSANSKIPTDNLPASATIYHTDVNAAEQKAMDESSVQLSAEFKISEPAESAKKLSVGPTGAGNVAPIDNMEPYLAVNFIIALSGIFPSRG